MNVQPYIIIPADYGNEVEEYEDQEHDDDVEVKAIHAHSFLLHSFAIVCASIAQQKDCTTTTQHPFDHSLLSPVYAKRDD